MREDVWDAPRSPSSAEKGYENTDRCRDRRGRRGHRAHVLPLLHRQGRCPVPGQCPAVAHLAQVVAGAVRDGQGPLEAALAAVRELAGYASQEPERVLLIAQVIPAVPALAGRELLRQRQVADAIGKALGDEDVPILDAQLAAETAVAVWRVSGAEWARKPEGRSILDVVESTAGAARAQARREPITNPAT